MEKKLRFHTVIHRKTNTNGCEASISATIDGRIKGAIKAGEQIIRALNHPATMGHKMAEAAVIDYFF